MLKWPTIKGIVRRTLGGILMGWGALLIPGGNDTPLTIGFPMGASGRARLRAARCLACRTHRQIRLDGKILVMTVAHVTIAFKACCVRAPRRQRRRGRATIRGREAWSAIDTSKWRQSPRHP